VFQEPFPDLGQLSAAKLLIGYSALGHKHRLTTINSGVTLCSVLNYDNCKKERKNED
jgi:hypothetical protein